MKSKKPKPGRVLLVDEPLQVHCPSLETREAHEFDPNGRGLCSICHLPKNVLEHKRWQERAYEEAQAAHDALHDRSKEEEQERVTREGAKRAKIGDTVYWYDPEDGKRSGFYTITSMRIEEYIDVTGEPKEEAIFTLDGVEADVYGAEPGELEQVDEFYLDFPPFPPGWVPAPDGRDRSHLYEEVVEEQDRMLDAWLKADLRLLHARNALAEYE
jgi:hypothetical protein